MKSMDGSSFKTSFAWIIRPMLVCVLVASLYLVVRAAISSPPQSTSGRLLSNQGLPASPQGTSGTGTSPSTQNNDEIQRLSERLSSYEKYVGYLEDRSKFLLILTGLFAVLLGVGAVLNLQAAVNSADRIIRQLEADRSENEKRATRGLKEISDLTLAIDKRFPLFARLDQNLDLVIQTLKTELRSVRGEDDDYARLSPAATQKILFYESAVSSLLFLDPEDIRDEIADVYRLLGNFYGSRYSVAISRTRSEADHNETAEQLDIRLRRANADDLHRSSFYFDRALSGTAKRFRIYNLKGHFLMHSFCPEWLDEARLCFARSLELEPNQQKPYLNLANIEEMLQHAGWVDRAVALTKQATEQSNYEDSEVPDRTTYTRYCRAYFYALQAEEKEDESERTAIRLEALTDLEAVSLSQNKGPTLRSFNDEREVWDAIKNDPSLKVRFEDAVSRLTEGCG